MREVVGRPRNLSACGELLNAQWLEAQKLSIVFPSLQMTRWYCPWPDGSVKNGVGPLCMITPVNIKMPECPKHTFGRNPPCVGLSVAPMGASKRHTTGGSTGALPSAERIDAHSKAGAVEAVPHLPPAASWAPGCGRPWRS